MDQTEQIINSLLSQEAFQRYNRIKIYHKEKMSKINALICNLYYTGQIRSVISDDDFVKIISQVEDTEKKVEIKINRRKGDFDLDD
ncbi:hypothetical protein GVAV_001295 [Gurleya vavrai]